MMKILLLGEYSNVHWTLAQGLRQLGYDVTVASSGDRFKNYKRDINISRESNSPFATIQYLYDLARHFRTFKGYDVVQIINPFFLDLKADKNLYAFNFLKKNNGKVFLGAFGDDAYWLRACLDKETFRYSEFNIPGRNDLLPSAQQLIHIWSDKDKIRINKEIADKSDGIIACLYEYYMAYKPYFPDKLSYIPEPVNTEENIFHQKGAHPDSVSFFIGIQKLRSEIKGTDILYKVLKEVHKKYPKGCRILKAESVPYHQYTRMMEGCDVILDQLYSYSPAMNALLAMSKGLVAVGGGEPEIYELLNETVDRPVINVIPAEEDIYQKLEHLILNKEKIAELSLSGRKFIEKHHDYVKVAKQYVEAWNKSVL
ncbi:MAG: glycosyltransferase family 1 protein [Dysgonomonas sp.]|nr:glycosyltransferase family 1 protein [Dysgonomonas sp.]